MRLVRYFKALVGLILFLACARRFDPGILRKRRVAIVGPADSTKGLKQGKYLDEFDVVIRINKSALVMSDGHKAEDIGKKLDILFHCFYENTFSGGGPLDFEMFDKLKVKYVVNPRSTFDGLRTTFNFYKKYLSTRKIYLFSTKLYREVERSFGKYRPTTGFAALYVALNADFEELWIGGFTFFKTGYDDGYRDEMKDKNQAIKYIEKMEIHNPDLEFQRFIEELDKNKLKNISLDPTLRKIVSDQIEF